MSVLKEIHRDGGISLEDLRPKSRVVNESHGYICLKCNSTAGKVGFLGLFGERLCDNQECDNSKPKFKKL